MRNTNYNQNAKRTTTSDLLAPSSLMDRTKKAPRLVLAGPHLVFLETADILAPVINQLHCLTENFFSPHLVQQRHDFVVPSRYRIALAVFLVEKVLDVIHLQLLRHRREHLVERYRSVLALLLERPACFGTRV